MFKKLFRRLGKLGQRSPNGGFTLTEKIASLFMAGIITTAMISVIVRLIESDQREAAFIATEQEMQIALNYITEDLREAVYIYEDIDPIMDYLPDFTTLIGANTRPILVFWRTESLPDSYLNFGGNCNNAFASPALQQECQVVRIKRAAYTLVVYLQSSDPDPAWEGKSRILRYALPKYLPPSTQGGAIDLTQTTGFVDPALFNNFPTWPLDRNGSNQQTEIPDPTASGQPQPIVLTDYIDSPDRTEFRSASQPNLPEEPPSCETGYERVPADADENNSFFACVRSTDNRVGRNQDVIVYLRGNAEGRNKLSKTVDFLPTLEAQVTLRGVIDKF